MKNYIYISFIFLFYIGEAASQNTVNSTSFRFDDEAESREIYQEEVSSGEGYSLGLLDEKDSIDDQNQQNDSAGFLAKGKKAAGLSVGKVLAWQDYSLYLSYQYSSKIAFWVSNGFGRSEFRDKYEDLEYNLEIKSISLKVGARYYFLQLFPLYVQSSLGFSRLSGDISASRIVQEGAEPESTLFNSSYSSLACTLDLNIGLQYVFKNNWYIDYTIMNLNSSLPFSLDVDTGNKQLESAVKDKLNDVFQYGIFNIGFGYTW